MTLSERRRYRTWTAQQKLEIGLAGLRGDVQVKELCRRHEIAETLYYSWREKLLAGGREVLAGKEERQASGSCAGGRPAAVDELLERARAAGEVREDVVAGDVAFLIQAIAQAGVALERSAPGAWRRYLDLVLDGLRPQGARPLLRKPPTTAQLIAAKRRT